MQRYDYIQRVIEQLAAALARIAGLRAEGKHDEALSEIQQTYVALELNPHLVRSLDAVSLARLLRESERVQGVARLLAEEAELRALAGEPGVAVLLRRRALGLCRALGPASGGAVAELTAELERRLESEV